MKKGNCGLKLFIIDDCLFWIEKIEEGLRASPIKPSVWRFKKNN